MGCHSGTSGGSLKLAAEGTHPKNTVCITYRPSMDPGYEIQFQVYGPGATGRTGPSWTPWVRARIRTCA